MKAIELTLLDGSKIPVIPCAGFTAFNEPIHKATRISAQGVDHCLILVKETPAEIRALIDAAEREERRWQAAVAAMQGVIQGIMWRHEIEGYTDQSAMSESARLAIIAADALLAQLDARKAPAPEPPSPGRSKNWRGRMLEITTDAWSRVASGRGVTVSQRLNLSAATPAERPEIRWGGALAFNDTAAAFAAELAEAIALAREWDKDTGKRLADVLAKEGEHGAE